MQNIVFIGIAGLAGTLGRYWLSGVIDARVGPAFPLGTVVVNLSGCFIMGFLFHTLTERFLVDPVIRSALLIGLLGGFTTFSSFGIQTLTLLQEGALLRAGLNIVISNVGGILLVWAGHTLSQTL